MYRLDVDSHYVINALNSINNVVGLCVTKQILNVDKHCLPFTLSHKRVGTN